ncbi:MAG: PLDc-N domain-containing protein [Sporanaerobacter sp.]|uniref:CLC_0170 family protein n=1 Tax=Sporanaerobacter sp. TaxID=2010183 RepID=UPI003A0FDEFB
MFFGIREMLKHIFGIYFLLAIVFICLCIFLVDIPRLKKRQIQKEANMAKCIGIFYIVVSPILYILFRQ